MRSWSEGRRPLFEVEALYPRARLAVQEGHGAFQEAQEPGYRAGSSVCAGRDARHYSQGEPLRRQDLISQYMKAQGWSGPAPWRGRRKRGIMGSEGAKHA
jgi:hypothetical protein